MLQSPRRVGLLWWWFWSLVVVALVVVVVRAPAAAAAAAETTHHHNDDDDDPMGMMMVVEPQSLDIDIDVNNNHNQKEPLAKQFTLDEVAQLPLQQQQDECRRHPTWRWSMRSSTDDDDDDDTDDNWFFDTCRRVCQAHEYQLFSRRDLWERELEEWYHHHPKAKGDTDEALTEDDHVYWMDWWLSQHDKDSAMNACLFQKEKEEQQPQSSPYNHTTTRSLTIAEACAPSSEDNQDDTTKMQATSRYSHVTDGDLVTVQNALTDCEAVWVQALVDCLHDHVPWQPPFYEERAFGNANDPNKADTYGLYKPDGGNHVVFLAALLQRFLPGVVHSLYQAVHAAFDLAQWGDPDTLAHLDQNHFYAGESDSLPHPMTLGIRTAEYLHYHTTGRLGQHADTESIYTISIALSDPDDYQGGYFQMEQDQRVYWKPPRLSAVVFFSEATHGITPITAGQRTVLVTELWPLQSVPLGMARPTLDAFRNYVLERQGLPPVEYNKNQEDGDDDEYEDDYYYDDEEEDEDEDDEVNEEEDEEDDDEEEDDDDSYHRNRPSRMNDGEL